MCTAPVKNVFIGGKYASIDSVQFVGDYSQDLYKRLVDGARIPFQRDSTLSFIQHDAILPTATDSTTSLSGREYTVFKVPDAIPKALSLEVTLWSGKQTAIQPSALDTFENSKSKNMKWSLENSEDINTKSLPLNIQIHHATDVYVSKK